jgi:multidrug efflux system membrane fusion protein
LFCVFLAAIACGCQRGPAQIGASDMPVVPVAQPITRNVTPYVDFTGRTDAVEMVNVVARVTGYLKQRPFKEGSEVKAGDLLFEIDPRPYQAQFDQADSQVSLAQAQLDLAVSTLTRFKALKKEQPGAVSDQALDQYQAAVTEARARVNATQKSLEVYRLNKDFTRVTSTIDGQIGLSYLTEGNLVNQDQTLLATVVSLDPMYAYFEMDERTLLQIRRTINEGKIGSPGKGSGTRRERLLGSLLAACGFAPPDASAIGSPLSLALRGVLALALVNQESELPVFMALQGEDGFPHEGSINFANNQVNPGTGSITVRGLFANPKGTGGIRLLSPGMFVRIRFPIGEPHPALLVIDRAVQSDQDKKYVYVIGTDSKAQSRFVKTGPLQSDGLRVITDGLQAGDWVVVGAVQQVRPGMEVKTDPQKIMPSFQVEPGQ